MQVDELEGVPAPDELDAETANETTEPKENEEAPADAVEEAQESEVEEVEAEAGEETPATVEAETQEPTEPSDDPDPEQQETKSQRKRRLRREREQSLREDLLRKQKQIEALNKQIDGYKATDPNSAENYDEAVTQNAVNSALRGQKTAEKEALEAEQKEIEEQARAQKAQAWNEGVAELTHIKDFADRVYNDNVPFNDDIVGHIVEMERGPEIAYHLATNREELMQLHGLSGTALAVKLAETQARLSYPKPKLKSSAPKPIKPVKAQAVPADDSLEGMSYEEYKKARGM